MSTQMEHPTVTKMKSGAIRKTTPTAINAQWLRKLALEAGADDVGFVSVDRPEIAEQRADILRAMPVAKTLLSFVRRMNREAIRSPQRSLANVEFHHAGDDINDIGREIAEACEERGIRALNVTMGFPMEADRWPGQMGALAQAGRRRRRAGHDGHPPQRYSSQVRQLHSAGHGPARCEARRGIRRPGLQPLPHLQAVRRSLPNGGDRTRWQLQFL